MGAGAVWPIRIKERIAKYRFSIDIFQDIRVLSGSAAKAHKSDIVTMLRLFAFDLTLCQSFRGPCESVVAPRQG
jgi:mevalonate pyrophosphate decarboxylase